MPIQLLFTPTTADYLVAMRLFMLKQRSTRLLLAVGVLMALFGVYSLFASNFQNWSTSLPAFLFIGIITLMLFVVNPYMLGKKIDKIERLHAEATWTVDEKGIRIKTSLEDSHLEWSVFSKFHEFKDYTLLVYSKNPNFFQLLPSRAFESTEQQEQFRTLLQVKVPGLR